MLAFDSQQFDVCTNNYGCTNATINPPHGESQDCCFPNQESRHSDCSSVTSEESTQRPFPPSMTGNIGTSSETTTIIRSPSTKNDRNVLDVFLQLLMIPSLLFRLLLRWQQQHSLSCDMLDGKEMYLDTTPTNGRSRTKQWSLAPNRCNHPSQSTLKLFVLLYSYILLSTTTILSSSVFVHAQTSNSTSDLCELTIWVYSDDQICKSLNPPAGVGTIIADNTCRTTDIDESQTPNPADYTLFPGTYRAQCTADGQSVHFFESGCKYANCSSKTVGADVCQRDITLHSSLYSRRSIPEYKVQRIQDATSSALFSCSALSDGYRLNLTFIIFGDCNSSACNRLATLSPTLPPVPTAPNSFESLPPETSPLETIAPTYYDNTAAPISTNARNDTVKVVMVLSEVDGTISGTAQQAWEDVTTKHIRASADDHGYTIGTVEISVIEQEALDADRPIVSNETSVGVPTRHRRTTSDRALVLDGRPEELNDNDNAMNMNVNPSNGIDIRSKHHLLRWLQNNFGSVRIAFKILISFPDGTPSTLTAAKVFSDAFDNESERTKYILNLVQADGTQFANVTKLQIEMDGQDNSTITTTEPQNNGVPTAAPVAINPSTGPQTPEKSSSDIGMIIGVAAGATVFLIVVGFFLYRRGKKDAMIHTKAGGSDLPTDGDISPNSTGLSSQQQQMLQQQNQRWTNEIIIDPSNDDVSTLGGSTLAELNLMRNGQRVTDEDEHTASVNIDYDFARNRYRTGALNEDATIDDRSRGAYTNQTNPTMYTTTSKFGGPSMVADDDMSFERQYDDDQDEDNFNGPNHDSFEVTNESGLVINATGKKHINGLKISPNVSMQNNASMGQQVPSPTGSAGTWLTKPFEINVPPGVLGMVIDTPGGSVPVVRAVKNTSVLFNKVQIGDRLLSVDHIDVTTMPAMQVSNLISTRSHLNRSLIFVRPIPSSVTTADT